MKPTKDELLPDGQRRPVHIDILTVLWFAEMAIKKLTNEENARKVHWGTTSVDDIMGRLGDEVGELEYALNDNMSDAEAMSSEAVDVSNFSMMVADKVRDETGKPLDSKLLGCIACLREFLSEEFRWKTYPEEQLFRIKAKKALEGFDSICNERPRY